MALAIFALILVCFFYRRKQEKTTIPAVVEKKAEVVEVAEPDEISVEQRDTWKAPQLVVEPEFVVSLESSNNRLFSSEQTEDITVQGLNLTNVANPELDSMRLRQEPIDKH